MHVSFEDSRELYALCSVRVIHRSFRKGVAMERVTLQFPPNVRAPYLEHQVGGDSREAGEREAAERRRNSPA